ncbi:MAG: DUF481 domain-containing protein [Gemmataceae bacterium]
MRLCLVLSLIGGLFAGPLVAQSPPGGQAYFGASKDAAFTQTGVFSKPEPMPAPSTDGGIFADPAPVPVKSPWKGSIEMGVNGSTGNSEVFNARAFVNADRKTETNLLHMDLLYQMSKNEGRTIQDQAIFNARDEILFPGSRWTVFAATNIEYDELRAYRFRVGVYAGVGYLVINDDTTLFKLRAGAGAVREIGGPGDRWVPEAVLGYDFSHKFTERQSFVSNLDYYPRIDDWTQYRVRARAAYEVILDPKTGTAFRIGAQSRYDSNPGPNIKRHDLTYFAALAFNF